MSLGIWPWKILAPTIQTQVVTSKIGGKLGQVQTSAISYILEKSPSLSQKY
jgi:hypothetical protein